MDIVIKQTLQPSARKTLNLRQHEDMDNILEKFAAPKPLFKNKNLDFLLGFHNLELKWEIFSEKEFFRFSLA